MSEVRKSGFADRAKPLEYLEISASCLGQSYPQHCPHLATTETNSPEACDPLGEPMSIRQVARLLGCSPWTVRQRHMPSGLPYFRNGNSGKLIFYRSQVVNWVLEQQKKGGKRK